MDDSAFDATLKELSNRVSQFSGITATTKSSDKGIFSKINLKSPMVYYLYTPLAIFIVLVIWKPKIVTEEKSIDGKLPEPKLSLKKAMIATLIISAMLGFIIFIRMYKKKEIGNVGAQ